MKITIKQLKDDYDFVTYSVADCMFGILDQTVFPFEFKLYATKPLAEPSEVNYPSEPILTYNYNSKNDLADLREDIEFFFEEHPDVVIQRIFL